MTVVFRKSETALDEPLPELSAEDLLATEIILRVRRALAPLRMNLRNLSRAHKNHAAHRKGSAGGHYEIEVVSEGFRGLKLKDRQSWIHAILKDLLKDKSIHALTMKLKSPEEAETLEVPLF